MGFYILVGDARSFDFRASSKMERIGVGARVYDFMVVGFLVELHRTLTWVAGLVA